MVTTCERVEAPDRMGRCDGRLVALLADDRLPWRTGWRSFSEFEGRVCRVHRDHWRPCSEAIIALAPRACWPKAWKRVHAEPSPLHVRYAFLDEGGNVVALVRSRPVFAKGQKLASVLEGVILPEPTPIDRVSPA